MYQEMQSIESKSLTVQSSLDDGLKLAKILFHSASTPILFVDEHFTILMANTSWFKLLGWDQVELIGSKVTTLMDEGQVQDFQELQGSLSRDEQYWRGEFRIRKPGGVFLNLDMTAQRIELRQQTVYVLYLDTDLEQGQRRQVRGFQESRNYVTEALNKALQSLEKERTRYQQDLAHHIEVNLLPTLDKMSRESNSQVRNSYQEVLTRQLASLSDGSGMEVDRDLLKLTPTEMEVCKYIQAGMSSKEIAEMMHSSFDTIQTHRKNIRRKMGLKGRKTPLCTFLRVEKRLPGSYAFA